MRVVVSAVFAAALASAGAAVAQVPGQPIAAQASYTVEPFTPAGQVTIQGTGVRLRAEPFSTPQTQVLSSGSTGLALNVVGIARLADWNWYQVVLKNGQKAFIRSDLTSAPSRGAGQGASAPTVIASAPTQPPTPPAYVPPAYTPPVPIGPQPVQLSPPVVVQPQTPVDTSGRPSLDLPRPSDPAGLQSH
ncbi:MAG: SH3 domain-containing protein [Thermoflexales bacterium]|nr:SH3 domain-containing protein [Thermoflexales bacterium]